MKSGDFSSTWAALTLRQKIVAGVSTAAVAGGLWLMVSLSSREGEALLFSGLDPAVSGEVAMALDGQQVPYTVRGSAIYVPHSERDRLRIELARQGLPASNGAGYELLDELNGFSTTADMFDAAYWRAKEGELVRTITAMPTVKTARVHLGVDRASAFRRRGGNKSASVTVESPAGLTREQAQSVQFLTALAVPELRPENVAVIDTLRGVVAGPGGSPDMASAEGGSDREAQIESRLMSLLEAHVGPGNAEVSVAIETDPQSVATTERVIDPDSRQVVTRNLTEERDTESGFGGTVTVASNLPTGDAETQTEDESDILRTRRDEEVVYTGTEIERQIQRPAGTVSRLSVAVLLNERYAVDDDGNTIIDPRSAEEIAAIEALVSSAAGINDTRGDQLTVRILPFTAPEATGATPPTFVETYVLPEAVNTAQLVFLGLIILVVALFVMKPALTPKRRESGAGDGTMPNVEQLDAAQLLTVLTEQDPDDAAAILDAWFEEDTTPQRV